MLKSLHIKCGVHYFVLILLSILLLASPCAARNSMQDFAGMKKTSTLNKSKATSFFGACTANNKLYKVGKAKVKKDKTFLFTGNFFRFCMTPSLEVYHSKKRYLFILYSYNYLEIPMYILYRNMKTYLA